MWLGVLPSGGTSGFGGERLLFQQVARSSVASGGGVWVRGVCFWAEVHPLPYSALLLFSWDVHAAAWPRERAYWSTVAAGDAQPLAVRFHHFCRDVIAALNSVVRGGA